MLVSAVNTRVRKASSQLNGENASSPIRTGAQSPSASLLHWWSSELVDVGPTASRARPTTMRSAMSLLLILLILLVLFGGGGFYAGGPRAGISLGGLILVVIVIMAVTGRL